MKIRTGFVSNSSSTSFTCDLCGNTEVFYDSEDHEDYGFYQCENEHGICQEEAIGPIEKLENDNIGRCISSKNCPICQLESFSQRDLKRYLKSKSGISEETVFAEVKKINKRRKVLRDSEYILHVTRELKVNELDLLEEVKSTFGTYDKFREHIRGV